MTEHRSSPSAAPAAPGAWPSAGASVLASLDRRGHAADVFAGLEDLVPGFADLTIAVALGGVVGRPGLDLARREVATIAALCSLGRETQLAVHLDYALTLGVTRHELAEVLMQMAVYAGWPSAVSGLHVLREVLEDRVDARYDLGDVTVTVISDGHVDMPLATFAAGLGAEEAVAIEREHGPLGATVPVPLNCVVIEREGLLVVVDPGSAPTTTRRHRGWFLPRRATSCARSPRRGSTPSRLTWSS
jgi:4-carboxymuconolactone decarboxylase